MTETQNETSPLVQHAERELRLAGLFDADSDYEGELGRAVLELVRMFAGQGHSGGSAFMTIDILERLLKFENLTPLTDDPEEWMQVDVGLWQCVRSSDAFSHDGGKTYYRLSSGQEKVFTSESR